MADANIPKNKTLKMHLLELTSMLVKLKRTRLPISNIAYNTTLDQTLMASIKKCENNESLVAAMDYPLCESSMVHGVMGLKAYMLNLLYENVFCSEFDREDILKLYTAACKNKNYDEERTVFNFFTLVYLNALFCDYLKKDYGTLKISENDCYLIQDLLGKLTDEDRYLILFGSAKHFTFGSLAYNNKAYEKIFPLISSALRRKNIEKLLIVEK